MMQTSQWPLNILLVEDDSADRFLFERFFRSESHRFTLHFAKDGCEALDFLKASGETQIKRPHLIVLDLNLPKKDGRELLAELKSDTELKTIPVIVLTTSESEADQTHCLALGAEKFLSKPSELDSFNAVLGSIVKWLESAVH